MALLQRKRVILIESETTYGSDPTPTAADVVLVRDLSITPQASDVHLSKYWLTLELSVHFQLSLLVLGLRGLVLVMERLY